MRYFIHIPKVLGGKILGPIDPKRLYKRPRYFVNPASSTS